MTSIATHTFQVQEIHRKSCGPCQFELLRFDCVISHTRNVHKEGYILHGKLQTFTCVGLQSIGTLCPQFSLCKLETFSAWISAIFPYARPQRCPRTSADIFEDIFADVNADIFEEVHGHLCGCLCGHLHGWVLTSTGPKALLELLPLLCKTLLIIRCIT